MGIHLANNISRMEFFLNLSWKHQMLWCVSVGRLHVQETKTTSIEVPEWLNPNNDNDKC